MHPFVLYLAALALTLTIETPLYALGSTIGPAGAGWRAGGSTGLRVNLVSHPLAFIVVFPLLAPLVGTLTALVAVEVGVVYLEALLVWRGRATDPLGALALSCVANVASLAIGLVVLR